MEADWVTYAYLSKKFLRQKLLHIVSNYDLNFIFEGDRSDWSESVFVRKCAEKSIKNPSSSTNSKILKSVEKTATTHEQTGTPALAHSEAPVHVTDSTLNSQYQHIFERPERFRTNTLPKKISEIKSGSENSSTSSLSSSLSSFHSTILSPLSLSPTDALSPKNKLSSNRKTLNLPAATTGEKSSNCHYPSHIHQEEIKDMKSSLHNCQPSSTSISSSSNMVSDSNERVEYTPCSSTATSRATTAVVNPVSPQVGRRRSVFVKRKGVDNNIDKVKATDKNHGKNISQSDVDSGSGSIDRRVIKNDDESVRYRHRSSRKASEWKSFQGSNSSSSSLCTADIAAVFPQFNTNKSAESENMKISSLNQSNSSARQAWGGINGSLRRSMKSSSSISDVEGKEIIEDGLYTSSAVVSNDNDDDDDDDGDDYSDDMEIEEDEEANILEYKNHSQKSNELTDDEIGEEEPVAGLATLKMGRRKSSIYVPTNEKNGNWRRDPENISKENRKNISPSHRIRTKKEDKKRFHLSGSSNTSFRGDIDKNVGRYREKEDEIKKEEVIDEENGEDKDSLQEKLYELIPPKGINNYEHPVRIEPTHGSTIIGYLLPGTCIVALAVAGIWGKVQCHKKVREIDVKSVRSTRKESDICGWCLLNDITNKHLFLKSNEVINEDIEDEEEINKLQKISKSYNKKSDVNDLQGDIKKSEKTALLNKVKKVIKQDVQPIEKNVRVNNIDTWQEMFDDEGGYAYFYNSSTGETSWEAPEWVEETDPESGSK